MSDTVRIETRHGPMLALRGDQFITTSLDLYGEFSGLEWRLFDQLVQPGMTVVEMGANIGAHTIPLARKCAPAPLLAFEPQQRVFQLLCANLVINDITNVSAYPEAVGREDGVAHLPQVDYGEGGNFGGVPIFASGRGGASCRVTALDSLGLEACGFLKIDVEGSEREALLGASDTIRRLRPLIYVENDRKDRQQGVIDTLHDLGYRMYWHAPQLFDPGNFRRAAINVFGGLRSLNLLCLPAEGDDDVGGMAPLDPENWTVP